MVSLGWNAVGGLHFLRVKAPLDSSLSFYFLLSPVLRHVFPQLYSVGVSLVAWMVKNLPANAGDPSLIPGWGRSPGGGNGNPLQYSCLENPMDRGTWRARVHRLQTVGHDWASNIHSMDLCSSHLLPSPPEPLPSSHPLCSSDGQICLLENSLVVQWLGLHAVTVMGLGFDPWSGNWNCTICAAWPTRKKERKPHLNSPHLELYRRKTASWSSTPHGLPNLKSLWTLTNSYRHTDNSRISS